MVHPSVEDRLEKMLVHEQRNWSTIDGRYVRSENLDPGNDSRTAMFSSSSIWHGFEMTAISNPDNALPRSLSGGSSMVSSEKAGSNGGTIPVQTSKFLGVTEQARLKEWSKNIDANADPQLVGEEPVELDPEALDEPATKRLVADSDSGSEEEKEVTKTSRRVEADSDDDSDSPPVRKSQSIAQATTTEYGTTRFNRKVASQLLADHGSGRGLSIPQQANQKPIPSSANVVSAADFYAGIPREEEQPGSLTNPLQQGLLPQPQRQAEEARKQRRGFGFDGTAEHSEDEKDEKEPVHQQYNAGLQDQEYKAHAAPLTDNTSTFKSQVQFEPSSYGVNERKSQHDSTNSPQSPRDRGDQNEGEWQAVGGNKTRSPTHNFCSRQHWDNGHSGPPHPTSPMARTTSDGNYFRLKQGHEDQGLKTKPQKPRLIDLDEDDRHATRATTTMPPPGLDLRNMADLVPRQEPSGLNSPIESTQQPLINAVSDQAVYNSEGNTLPALSPGGRRTVVDYTPQTQVHKRDISQIRSNVLNSLTAAKRRNSKNKKKSQPVPIGERIEEEDEVSSRKYYNTMNLQASNPGKSKKKPKGGIRETASEAAARRAEALKDAYGPPKQPQKPGAGTTDPAPAQLPQEARKLSKTNPSFASSHANVLQNNLRTQLLKRLVEKLGPIFDASRAFPAAAVESRASTEHTEVKLEFEIQLGQILTSSTSRIKEKKVYERQTWERMFDVPEPSFDVLFSNILTNNGAEIDRLLAMKTGGRNAWDRNEPGQHKVVLEFKCQDKAGLEFKLHVDDKANYHISKGAVEIGKVGIHCPGRIWDACAVLSGTPRWQDIPQEVELAVKDLIHGMHVKQEPVTTVFHRSPPNNSLTVHEVVLQRTSQHRSLIEGEGDLMLKITEVKSLCTQMHLKDKRLFKSFEKPDYEQMAGERRVHYEVSLIHQRIAQGFQENKTLEIGEVTPESSTGQSLLTLEHMQPLLNAALRQVDKMDWVGMYNYGSVRHKKDLEAQRKYDLAATIPPAAAASRYARPMPMPPAGLNIAGPRTVAASRMASASQYGGPTLPIQGIRMNTMAEVWQDPDGALYRIGIGNARIPLGNEDPTGSGDRDVLPDDSASQAGGTRRVRQMAGLNDKPPDFW